MPRCFSISAVWVHASLFGRINCVGACLAVWADYLFGNISCLGACLTVWAYQLFGLVSISCLGIAAAWVPPLCVCSSCLNAACTIPSERKYKCRQNDLAGAGFRSCGNLLSHDTVSWSHELITLTILRALGDILHLLSYSCHLSYLCHTSHFISYHCHLSYLCHTYISLSLIPLSPLIPLPYHSLPLIPMSPLIPLSYLSLPLIPLPPLIHLPYL